MGRYADTAVERAMKVQEVILRAIDGRLKWFEAAEILGVSCRTMHRLKLRYQHRGYDGLIDRRRRTPSDRRMPLQTVERVLRLYREEYKGFNIRHFHELLKEEQGIELSYSWVKTALQTAGLVGKRRKRGPHRQRRERRPLQGMLVHCDGSDHGWIPALEGQRQCLVAFLDDATNEVLDARFVPEEGTLPIMAGIKRILENKGLFASFYTDRAGHFFNTPRAGGKVDKEQLTQLGRALSQLGIEHIPSYSPQARGRMERLFGTWQGRLPNELRRAKVRSLEQANDYLVRRFIPWHNRRLTVPARDTGDAYVPCESADLDSILCVRHERIVGHDNTLTLENLRLQIPAASWRSSFAKCRVTICRHLDDTLSVGYGSRLLARFTLQGVLIPTAKRKVA